MMTATTSDHAWRLGGRGGRQRMIADPETGELHAYQRTSTFAKTLDDKEGLMAWKAWMAVRGTFQSKALAESANHATATPKGVIDELAELGGAGVKRDRGKDRHEILAMALAGHPLPDMPPQAQAELDALLQQVDLLGVPVALEAPNVNDEYRVSGSADLILSDRNGGVIVCDFKSGSRVDRLSASIQLIAYARAQYWDFDTERRTGWVCEDKPRLVVLHAPQDGSPPCVVELDVAKAKRWAELAVAVREARKQAAAVKA